MKTTLQNKLTAILVTTVAGGFLMVAPMQSQVHTRGSAKGGATKLMRVYAAEQLKATGAARTQAMACADCRDDLVTVRENRFKGAGAKPLVLPQGTKQVLRHACGDCQTHWKVTGHGKQKAATPVHACAKCL